MPIPMSATFHRAARGLCDILKGAMIDPITGISGEEVTRIANLAITIPQPLDEVQKQRLGLTGTFILQQCFCHAEPEVEEGDILNYKAKNKIYFDTPIRYVVRKSSNWDYLGNVCQHLALEKVTE